MSKRDKEWHLEPGFIDGKLVEFSLVGPINPELRSLIDRQFHLLTSAAYAPQVARQQDVDMAAADVVNILRSVWDMKVSLGDIRAYGAEQAADMPYPSTASYLRFVYYELSAGNRKELAKIREWLASRKGQEKE